MSVKPREIPISLLRNRQCVISLFPTIAPPVEIKSNDSTPVATPTSPATPRAVDPAIMAAAALGVEPAQIVALDPTKCPCVVINRVTKERTICGRKVKADGRCGLHQGKCIQNEVANDKVSRAEIEERDRQEIIVEVEEKTDRCPCLIKSGKHGQEGKLCGRKIKANGRCGIHKNACGLAVNREQIVVVGAGVDVEQKVSPREAAGDERCKCYIKRTKKPCGRKARANGRCGIHQKVCFDSAGNPVPTGVIPGGKRAVGESMITVLPTIEEEKDTEDNIAARDLAKELDDIFEEELAPTESEIADAELAPLVVDPGARAEQPPVNEWKVYSVDNLDSILEHVDGVRAPEDIETVLFKLQIASALGLAY